MEQRINIKNVQPEAYKAMSGLEAYLATTGLNPLHKDLIKVRASQINGCAFCIDMHTKEARKHGETEERLYLVSAWREAVVFSEEERVILAMTEEVTLISKKGLTKETYDKAIAHFGETVTAQLLMVIVTINSWNRIAVSTHLVPGKF